MHSLYSFPSKEIGLFIVIVLFPAICPHYKQFLAFNNMLY